MAWLIPMSYKVKERGRESKAPNRVQLFSRIDISTERESQKDDKSHFYSDSDSDSDSDCDSRSVCVCARACV
jgi:hypothetical protein